jgi:hypothetical protein
MIGFAVFFLLLAPQTPSTPGLGLQGPQGPLFGGVPNGEVTPGPLPLSLSDAIDRALVRNLALVLAEQGVRSASGVRQEAMGDVLPHLFGRLSGVRQKISLEAFGFSSFPGIDDPVVGPFNVFDSRLFVTEELDLKGLHKARAEGQRVEAARWTYQDTRELVVLVAGSLYLGPWPSRAGSRRRGRRPAGARCTSSPWTARRRAWCRAWTSCARRSSCARASNA